jgi:ParB/RepB/Spo0J family partition protein
MPDDPQMISLDKIVEPWIVLRVVNRESLEYLELRDSIAAHGLLNSICVRPSIRRPGMMEVVDGLHRHAACCELRLPAMPCIVKENLTDEDVMAFQIQANALRPETTVVDYARQIKRIMEAVAARQGSDVTLAQVCKLIHKGPDWVRNQLFLLNLRPDIQKAVERGEVPLVSAYVLAQLPRIRQAEFLDMVRTTPAKDAVPLLARAVKQIKEAARQGKLDDFRKDFEPVPYLRPLKEILGEYQRHEIGGLMLTKGNCQTPLDAWYSALQWALHLDEDSIREQEKRILARNRTNVLRRRTELCDEMSNPNASLNGDNVSGDDNVND